MFQPDITPKTIIDRFATTQLETCTAIKESVAVETLSNTPEKIMGPEQLKHQLRSDHIVRMFTSLDIEHFASTLSTWRNEWKELIVVPLIYYYAEQTSEMHDDNERMDFLLSLKSYYPDHGYASMVREYIQTGNPKVARVFGNKVAIVTFTLEAKEVLSEQEKKIKAEYSAKGTVPEEVFHDYHSLPL
ncbi:MAG: hypothetical protein K2H85_10050, partial [Allobaculum sp.]|nr:hypothetical protein [Allobaculum sp.]